VAVFAMEMFTSRPVGDSMVLTIWGSHLQLDAHRAAAVPVDGRDPVPQQAHRRHVQGPGALAEPVPGRLLHANVVGCTIFAAVSGSSAATCATIGKITLPELKKRGYPDDIAIGTLAGAGTWAC
jgi:C4-dicarboxylate transporter DctM subunit